jgi:hypothetical protein
MSAYYVSARVLARVSVPVYPYLYGVNRDRK